MVFPTSKRPTSSLSSIAGVKDALDSLSSLWKSLHYPSESNEKYQPHEEEKQGLDCIKKLSQSLIAAEHVLNNPDPGTGLSSMFARCVLLRLDLLKNKVESGETSWFDLFQDKDKRLEWLADLSFFFYGKTESRVEELAFDISHLLYPNAPTKSALMQYAEIAELWEHELKDAPTRPHRDGMNEQGLVDHWKPWKEKEIKNLDKLGRLVLQAIDNCEISPDLRIDNDFSRKIIEGISSPGKRLMPLLCGQEPSRWDSDYVPIEKIRALLGILTDASSPSLSSDKEEAAVDKKDELRSIPPEHLYSHTEATASPTLPQEIPERMAERESLSPSEQPSRSKTATDPDSSFERLPIPAKKAYQQHEAALEQDPSLEGKIDKDVYAHVKRKLDPGEEIVSEESWTRYLREARNVMGTQKNTSRGGRITGKSIVREDEI